MQRSCPTVAACARSTFLLLTRSEERTGDDETTNEVAGVRLFLNAQPAKGIISDIQIIYLPKGIFPDPIYLPLDPSGVWVRARSI